MEQPTAVGSRARAFDRTLLLSYAVCEKVMASRLVVCLVFVKRFHGFQSGNGL